MVLNLSDELAPILKIEIDKLSQSIQKTLLDSSSFTQAENNFLKKFNTIKKAIQKNKYVLPESDGEIEIKNIREKIRELEQEKNTHQQGLNFILSRNSSDSSVVGSYRVAIGRCSQEIQMLQQQLQKLG